MSKLKRKGGAYRFNKASAVDIHTVGLTASWSF